MSANCSLEDHDKLINCNVEKWKLLSVFRVIAMFLLPILVILRQGSTVGFIVVRGLTYTSIQRQQAMDNVVDNKTTQRQRQVETGSLKKSEVRIESSKRFPLAVNKTNKTISRLRRNATRQFFRSSDTGSLSRSENPIDWSDHIKASKVTTAGISISTSFDQPEKEHLDEPNVAELLETSRRPDSEAPLDPNAILAKSVKFHDREEQRRLESMQILEKLEAGTLNMSQIPLVFPKPPSDSFEITSIYSRSAWSRLRSILLDDNNETIMCVSGGSSSTGCPDTAVKDRYHQLFAGAFRNVTVVDRAHGARNSMHTVQLMHSYFPMHTDIILWEFSINDATYFQFTNQTAKIMEARNQLILFLDQVARLAKQRQQANPPLVILVFLWNPNHFVNRSITGPHYITIPHLVYQATQGVAESYDFVVGHINVGSYFDTLWAPNVTQTHFMADPTHPNTMAHQVIHYLLRDLVTNEQRIERPKIRKTRPLYTWACGTDTPEKLLLRKLIKRRYPIASFTQELPKNEELLPGMLLPLVGEGDLKIQNLGKTNALRSDRKYSVTIPCCSGSSSMKFDDIGKHGILQGIQLSLFPNSSGLTVFFDNQNVTNKLIDCSNAKQWECVFSDTYKVFYYWVILKGNRNVSSIALCNHLATCGNSSKDLSVQSMIVYGEDTSL